ncbi:flagellar motor control protein ZomB [Nocardia acidivorans]|uniref:flagellar motor control protein ZomB n=1 Tax=Nocardia acidivorans TaxID=404580 RepID=UPI000A7D66D1|nr:flagellar motor control protein ZomB [Nocardia acidivorans]
MTLSISPDVVQEWTGVAEPAVPPTVVPEDVSTPSPRFVRAVLIGGVLLTATLFASGAWQRRWIADDGLIVLRTVRNLLAGNGPVFNMNERVETNTSTAWTYVVWFFSWLTGLRLEYVVLGLSLTLSVLATVIAMAGAARLWGGTGSALLIPAGALVYIALPPARDYASSGLESPLVLFWLAVLWWSMIRWSLAHSVRPAGFFAVAGWAGLAPLIRPELVLVGALALLMLLGAPVPSTRLRPWVFRAAAVALAGLVPLAYQIWRMGYYGLPYPNTAVAKEAGGAKWQQGFVYLEDLVGPYWLWVPLVILAVWAGVMLWERRTPGAVDPEAGETVIADRKALLHKRIRQFSRWLRNPSSVVTLMVGSGVLLTVYELRVGGDFMHGRMLLPQLFCLLMPVMVLPIRLFAGVVSRQRPSLDWPFAVVLAAFLGTLGWAWFAAGTTAITSGTTIRASGIVDERIYYVLYSGHDHPIRAEDYLDFPRMRPLLRDIAQTPNGGLVINLPDQTYWYVIPPPEPVPAGGAGHTVFFLNLGMSSMNVPLNVRVLDPVGLAYPIAAHTDRLTDGRIGHDKNLDASWVVADTGVVALHPWMAAHIKETQVEQARTALSCPTTQDLIASTRAPLTFTRFRHNVVQALGFASARIERIARYDLQRCGLPEPVPPAPR